MSDPWPESPSPKGSHDAVGLWAWEAEPQARRDKKKRKQEPWVWEDQPPEQVKSLDSLDVLPDCQPQRKSQQPPSAGSGVHLCFGKHSLEAGFSMTSDRKGKPLDKFEAQGCDPQLVRARLDKGCCTCSSHAVACHRGIAFKALLACAVAFWAMT